MRLRDFCETPVTVWEEYFTDRAIGARIGAMAEITPAEFKRTLELLLGFGAQRKFARLIGRDDTTVRRWVSGARKIPPEVPLLIALLWEREHMGLPMEVDIPRAFKEIHSNQSKSA